MVIDYLDFKLSTSAPCVMSNRGVETRHWAAKICYLINLNFQLVERHRNMEVIWNSRVALFEYAAVG
jgi:hypothetical protein